MSSDIVKRLRAVDLRRLMNEAADAIEARDAEIVYLRAEFSAVLGDAIAKDAEIERLRAALALAIGELSTYGPMRYTSPDQLLEHFMQEARRG